MSSKIKNNVKNFYNRLKNIKHIEIYLSIGLALFILFIYLSTFSYSKDEKNVSSNKDNIQQNFNSSQEYVLYLENKLESVLTNVKNAGDVSVLITLEKGFEYIYAKEEETKTTTNGTIISTSDVVLVNGKPILLEEIYPIIKGVVVISSGAYDPSVKLNITSLLQTVINIDNSKINIIVGK